MLVSMQLVLQRGTIFGEARGRLKDTRNLFVRRLLDLVAVGRQPPGLLPAGRKTALRLYSATNSPIPRLSLLQMALGPMLDA